jgi:hypothetical protein
MIYATQFIVLPEHTTATPRTTETCHVHLHDGAICCLAVRSLVKALPVRVHSLSRLIILKDEVALICGKDAQTLVRIDHAPKPFRVVREIPFLDLHIRRLHEAH